MVDETIIGSIEKPSVLTGVDLISPAKIEVHENAEFICSCNPRFICITDKHTGLLVAVNPERAQLKGIICSKPSIPKKEKLYELRLKDMMVKKQTGEKSNQLEKKCSPCSPCSSFPQPGSPPYPTPILIEKGFCIECNDIVSQLSEEYDELYVFPYLNDTKGLTYGKTIDNESLARVINAKFRYIVTHSFYAACAMKYCASDYTPITDIPDIPVKDTPKKTTNKYQKLVDYYCPTAHFLVAPIFDTVFNSVGLVYTGAYGGYELDESLTQEQRVEKLQLYEDTYTQVIQSDVYRKIRFSKEFIDMELSCHTTHRNVPDECAEFANYDPLTDQWTPISDNFIPCLTKNKYKPTITTNIYKDCEKYIDENGVVTPTYFNCVDKNKNKPFEGYPSNIIDPDVCDECSHLLVGILLFRNNLGCYNEITLNSNFYLETINKSIESKFTGDLSVLKNFITLSDTDLRLVATFTYPQFMSMPVENRQMLFKEIEWLHWQKSPQRVSYVDGNGITNEMSLYDLCYKQNCGKTPIITTEGNPTPINFCPECTEFIDIDGNKLTGYEECFKINCYTAYRDIPKTDRICDSSLNCEPCKEISLQYGMRSDEWIDCYLDNCFVYCAECQDTLEVFGMGIEYFNCVQNNCASMVECSDCLARYENNIVSRDYLKCMISECFLKDMSLCLQCCDISDSTLREECIRKFCNKENLKIDPCIENDLSKTIKLEYTSNTIDSNNDKDIPKICDSMLSPDYIDILREHNIEILIAGKRVLVNEIPYIEDRIRHDDSIIIRRSRLFTRNDVIKYLGKSVNSLSIEDLEKVIVKLQKQLTQIIFSVLNNGDENMLVDSGIITACGYNQKCESQFYTITNTPNTTPKITPNTPNTTPSTNTKKNKPTGETTTITNKITNKTVVITTYSTPQQMVSMPCKDFDQKISNATVENLIKNDTKLAEELMRLKLMESITDLNQIAINFVKYKIVCENEELAKILEYITENSITNTNFVIEHLTGRETLTNFIKDDDRILKPRDAITKELEIAQSKFQYTQDVVIPISIQEVTPSKEYTVNIASNGINVIIPSSIIESALGINYDLSKLPDDLIVLKTPTIEEILAELGRDISQPIDSFNLGVEQKPNVIDPNNLFSLPKKPSNAISINKKDDLQPDSSSKLNNDIVNKIVSHLVMLERKYNIRTQEYIKGITVGINLPSNYYKEIPIKSESVETSISKLSNVVKETFISDKLVLDLFKQFKLEFNIEVKIVDTNYQNTPIIETIVNIDEEKVEEIGLNHSGFVNDIKILKLSKLYEQPIDVFIYTETNDNNDIINLEFKDYDSNS